MACWVSGVSFCTGCVSSCSGVVFCGLPAVVSAGTVVCGSGFVTDSVAGSVCCVGLFTLELTLSPSPSVPLVAALAELAGAVLESFL